MKPLQRPRPPRRGDVSEVVAYLRTMERYATELETRLRTAIADYEALSARIGAAERALIEESEVVE
jgi:hypothetical protein